MGLEDTLGTLEPGKTADIVAVSGDPSIDISLMMKVNFVMKNGKVYKITVENITPKPEEIPEEIEINWNNSHDFGNHEDITE